MVNFMPCENVWVCRSPVSIAKFGVTDTAKRHFALVTITKRDKILPVKNYSAAVTHKRAHFTGAKCRALFCIPFAVIITPCRTNFTTGIEHKSSYFMLKMHKYS